MLRLLLLFIFCSLQRTYFALALPTSQIQGLSMAQSNNTENNDLLGFLGPDYDAQNSSTVRAPNAQVWRIRDSPLNLVIHPRYSTIISPESFSRVIHLVQKWAYQQHPGPLPAIDIPFNSTQVAYGSNDCMITIQSRPISPSSGPALQGYSMTYLDLGIIVGGLFEFEQLMMWERRVPIESCSFVVGHDRWGVIGTGSLRSFRQDSIQTRRVPALI